MSVHLDGYDFVSVLFQLQAGCHCIWAAPSFRATQHNRSRLLYVLNSAGFF